MKKTNHTTELTVKFIPLVFDKVIDWTLDEPRLTSSVQLFIRLLIADYYGSPNQRHFGYNNSATTLVLPSTCIALMESLSLPLLSTYIVSWRKCGE
jgi:hypothetical protein